MKRKIYKKLQETISRSRKLTKRAWKIEQETVGQGWDARQVLCRNGGRKEWKIDSMSLVWSEVWICGSRAYSHSGPQASSSFQPIGTSPSQLEKRKRLLNPFYPDV